jgi:DNA-binding transcriptional MerR regulator
VIQAAFALGFTREELRRAFSDRAAGRPPCQRVRALAGAKLATVEALIEQLSSLRANIVHALQVWDEQLRRTSGEAALLDDLVDGPSSSRAASADRSTLTLLIARWSLRDRKK